MEGKAAHDGGNVSISDVEMITDEIVWASDEDALNGTPTFMRSTDGGDTLVVRATGIKAEAADHPYGVMSSIDFVGTSFGWSVTSWTPDSEGDGAVLVSTTDGGETWQHLHWFEMGLAATDRPSAIDFVDSTCGWMVGGVGRNSWRTRDGGLTWAAVDLLESKILLDVDFVSQSSGWAVGWDGAIFRYAVPTDTTPPTTTAHGYDAAWHKSAVTVTLSALDNPGGSGTDRHGDVRAAGTLT